MCGKSSDKEHKTHKCSKCANINRSFAECMEKCKMWSCDFKKR